MIEDKEEQKAERLPPRPVYQDLDSDVEWMVTSWYGGRKVSEYRE